MISSKPIKMKSSSKILYSIIKELFLVEVIILRIDFVCQEKFSIFFERISFNLIWQEEYYQSFILLSRSFFFVFEVFSFEKHLSTYVFRRVKATSNQEDAEVVGFEPTVSGPKTRRLTTWPHLYFYKTIISNSLHLSRIFYNLQKNSFNLIDEKNIIKVSFSCQEVFILFWSFLVTISGLEPELQPWKGRVLTD